MAPEAEQTVSLSVVIAAYNSGPWLPSTLASLVTAIQRASLDAEIIVVDDGSTDDTRDVLERFRATSPVEVRVVSQENRGRFLARWAGVQEARSARLMIFDSRLLLDPDALSYLRSRDEGLPEGQVWVGHVPTDESSSLVGRFWEVPTHLFWGSYLANPRPTEITATNFDRVPKGTGCLVIGRALFEQACLAAWPEENADLVSDDTKILRYVVATQTMRLDPGFRAIYRPRTTVGAFLGHAFDRGTLFVDSYAGTSVLRNVVLVALVLAPPLAVVLLVLAIVAGLGWAVAVIVALVVLGLALPAVLAAFRACPPRAVLSYFTFVVPFGALFWCGIARGVFVHRRSFGRIHPQNSESQ
ncbi:glycosyltransferase family A protein [Leifsonia sp. NPDC058230]|uniref:glycosyltransferase family A protein n=1 Tax=Leifsonia sp. NPDC058230 TaxID=3346391 RepID=UPI0036DAFA50